MVARIDIYACNAELKELAGREADRLGIPLSEFIVRKLAEGIGRPDLSAIPRKASGRPRNKLKLGKTG